jgi:2-polyprenyl-3-methyl-5-hydroxy-6-metoxy-1,4-benzoquinol methylase
MPSVLSLMRKAARRTWMKYAMRGVGAADAHERMDLAYSMPDPWDMDSNMERARFAATDALIQRTFGRLGSILELGCGEGHQTRHFAALADQVYGLDVSTKAIERARVALPDLQFADVDIFEQPWGEERGRFDLVTACEVMYYMKDVDMVLERMSHLGRACLVTFFSPALRRMAPHLERIPNLQKDWVYYGSTVWLVCWWRND